MNPNATIPAHVIANVIERAQAVIDAFGGDVPDWIEGNVEQLQGALGAYWAQRERANPSQRYSVLPTPCAADGGYRVWDTTGDRVAASHPDKAEAQRLAAQCNQVAPVPVGELLSLRDLVDGFHAVKQIRAHAAEENQGIKREAARIINRIIPA